MGCVKFRGPVSKPCLAGPADPSPPPADPGAFHSFFLPYIFIVEVGRVVKGTESWDNTIFLRSLKLHQYFLSIRKEKYKFLLASFKTLQNFKSASLLCHWSIFVFAALLLVVFLLFKLSYLALPVPGTIFRITGGFPVVFSGTIRRFMVYEEIFNISE